MRQCLTTHRCTKRQKKALYATAGTIAALVTIVLGIGIGSYIYAGYKKKQEAAALPGESTILPDAPISEQELKNLAQNQADEKLRGPLSIFQAKIQEALTPIKETTNYIQIQSQKIVQLLREKAQLAQTALATTTDRIKQSQLANAAAKALAEAKKQANDFVEEIKTSA